MTPKQIHSLEGQMSSACMIIRDIRQQLQVADKTETTRLAIAAADEAALKARKALRAIAYEIEVPQS